MFRQLNQSPSVLNKVKKKGERGRVCVCGGGGEQKKKLLMKTWGFLAPSTFLKHYWNSELPKLSVFLHSSGSHLL